MVPSFKLVLPSSHMNEAKGDTGTNTLVVKVPDLSWTQFRMFERSTSVK